jgi:hypothetical protein
MVALSLRERRFISRSEMATLVRRENGVDLFRRFDDGL